MKKTAAQSSRTVRLLSLCACALLLSDTGRAADIAPKPFFSPENGLASQSKWLNPGKVDLLYKYREDQSTYNAFLWTPSFKGGAGLIDVDGRTDTRYLGGFLRPLALTPERGDLLLGAQTVQAGVRDDYEVQGEYRFPFGLGVGGGFVEASSLGRDIVFGKLTFRRKWEKWNYILEVQGQETGSRTAPGGYGALYNAQWMAVAGGDGEQWRACLGYIAPENKSPFRPTIEVLYVDNHPGQADGTRFFFANATLRYRGGFLSHPARLGRAMGPQGLEFGNPLGFLAPTFNRRLEVWEMGELADLRAERVRSPNGAVQERYEALTYPLQWTKTRSLLDHVFLGGAYLNSPTKDTPAFIGGFSGKVGFMNLSVGVDHEFRPSLTTVTVGLVDTF